MQLGLKGYQLQLKEIWARLSCGWPPILEVLLAQIRHCWANSVLSYLSLLKQNWKKLHAQHSATVHRTRLRAEARPSLCAQSTGCLNPALLHRDLGQVLNLSKPHYCHLSNGYIYTQGRGHGHATCVIAQNLVLRRAPGLVECSAVTALKFLKRFEQETPDFQFALGPANCAAGPVYTCPTELLKSIARGRICQVQPRSGVG